MVVVTVRSDPIPRRVLRLRRIFHSYAVCRRCSFDPSPVLFLVESSVTCLPTKQKYHIILYVIHGLIVVKLPDRFTIINVEQHRSTERSRCQTGCMRQLWLLFTVHRRWLDWFRRPTRQIHKNCGCCSCLWCNFVFDRCTSREQSR